MKTYHQTKNEFSSLKIAVTGGAGSGKTSVCKRLGQLGLMVINSDDLAREAVAPGSSVYESIIEHFGKEVLASDGTLNRSLLRKIIVNDKAQRKALDQLIHPEIIRLMRRHMAAAEQNRIPVIIVEVPLLYELGLENLFDRVLVITTDRKLQIKRLMDRDKVTRDDAEALLKSQMPDEDKIKRADFIIKNNFDEEKMIESVDFFYKNILKNSKKRLKALDRKNSML
ncbi:MAG: dephospho-CoA kinase [Desulfobacterales bacterium]|nr:dephospho-CoA kinase [Desulfobacterales bacterium]